MKSSLGISNFLEEISSLSHSIVFLCFFALIIEEGFLAILWNSAFKWVYLSFSPLPFASLLFIAVCKASSDNHFAFLLHTNLPKKQTVDYVTCKFILDLINLSSLVLVFSICSPVSESSLLLVTFHFTYWILTIHLVSSLLPKVIKTNKIMYR